MFSWSKKKTENLSKQTKNKLESSSKKTSFSRTNVNLNSANILDRNSKKITNKKDKFKILRLLPISLLDIQNLAVIVAAITFIFSEGARRDADVYQAWKVITSAYAQPGNGGRKEAIEFLYSSPRRNPWFWLRWKKQNLAGLAVPKAYLTGIQLQGANLVNANFQEAVLKKANLQDANLFQANLSNANLIEAKLQRAKLIEANLQQTDLRLADLQQANLTVANLQQANLAATNLVDTNLSGANLKNADLRDQTYEMRGTILVAANLQQANLIATDLRYTDLRAANLTDALYTDKHTSKEVCRRNFSEYPCPTLFPENIDPNKARMRLIRTIDDFNEASSGLLERKAQ